ncbi:uncharacterized protein P174DRAFT_438954 [Aspergillus novofumigatus IBT 16806]|uniref:Uncharacterized protein n=1 Tax=Aspergillus novofumigatus (strain IBT 16806) TaxID=1392255 RepID=A0A2I1CHS3_ASPN1|nr:uncharacterized protein P174DRAFT_438954 [Aspergillus novofumigatus IBT 16806]PKX97150.1 hypothetical protein P174DRAFT_438954 [Aspergillus novofumigatus IBT 16806]
MRDSAARISGSDLYTGTQRVSLPGGGQEKAERTWMREKSRLDVVQNKITVRNSDKQCEIYG